jgi:hypothetical protein
LTPIRAANPSYTPGCTVGMEYAISLHTHESGNEPGAAIARYPHPDGAAG